jgi:hypothetical protein
MLDRINISRANGVALTQVNECVKFAVWSEAGRVAQPKSGDGAGRRSGAPGWDRAEGFEADGFGIGCQAVREITRAARPSAFGRPPTTIRW